MSVPQIIHQIDEVIRDTHTSREKNIENLKNLAMTCWQEVVPEKEIKVGLHVGRVTGLKTNNGHCRPLFFFGVCFNAFIPSQIL